MTTTVAPSPFAALLRRSKFASYDPSIGQVYTTFGGHAHRGDWGGKRALAKRTRKPYITIQSIDSRFQQTDWNDRRHDAQWMKKWAEVSKEPDLHDQGLWYKRLGGKVSKWDIDSDYVPKSSTTAIPANLDKAMDVPVPNIHAMDERQFERYVESLRRLRPDFKRFIEVGREEERAVRLKNAFQFDQPVYSDGEVILYQEAQQTRDWHTKFIEARTRAQSSDETSTALIQLPHPNAGLSYSHTPHLQDVMLSKPLPGRVVPIAGSERSASFGAAVGGFVGELPKGKSDGLTPLDLGNDDGHPRINKEVGKGVFRATRASLSKAPTSVGPHPERLLDAQMVISFRSWKTANAVRSNPHRPGSREYVALSERIQSASLKPAPSMMTKNAFRAIPRPPIEDREMGRKLISNLRLMLNKNMGANDDL